MPTPGVTTAGFVANGVTGWLSDIETDELATVDPQLDTSAENPIGQLNGSIAEKLAEVEELAQVAYNSVSRDDAEGNQLDNVGALTGSTRLPPKPSFVYCNVTLLAANSPYVAGSLVANVAGQPGVQFSNNLDINITVDGTSSQLFTALVDGPTLAPAGTLTQISTPVTGWSAVTNPLDATQGNLLESDEDYRFRQDLELASGGSGTVDAIEADLLAIPGGGVVSCNVIENTSMVTDPVTGTPPKSMQPVVWDGVGASVPNDTIAQALWNDKPAGISYFGTTSGNAMDSQGNVRVVAFSRPIQKDLYISCTVVFTPGLSSPAQTATIAAVKAALVAYGNSTVAPGVSVLALRLLSTIDGVSGVYDVTSCQFDFVPSPTNTANLPVTVNQVAVFDTSRILVNGV